MQHGWHLCYEWHPWNVAKPLPIRAELRGGAGIVVGSTEATDDRFCPVFWGGAREEAGVWSGRRWGAGATEALYSALLTLSPGDKETPAAACLTLVLRPPHTLTQAPS